MKPIKRHEVWYWPETNELLDAWKLSGKLWLMFRSPDRYYFNAITKPLAKQNGMIFLGEL